MLHIIFLLLCSSTFLFAGQVAAPTSSSTAPETIFGKLNVRPMDISRIYELSAHAQEVVVQQFLPPYTTILALVIDHASPQQMIKTLQDSAAFATINTKQPPENRLALFFQHNIHTLIACTYLQHNDIDKAYIATNNALATMADADLIDQFGCPAHSPLTALAAEHILQRKHQMHQDASNLTVLGGHIAAARAFMDNEITRKGPWTVHDIQLLQWYTATLTGKPLPLFNLTTFTQLNTKIQHVSPELYGLFLATQVEASMQATPADNELIRTTARTYGEYLFQTNPYDPDDAALRFLCIAAQHDDFPTALKVGTIYLERAIDAITIADQKMASVLACSYLKKASQSKDKKLADLATFNELKIANPYKDDDIIANIIQVTKQLTGFLKQKGDRHFLAPLVNAYLAAYYSGLVKIEAPKSVHKQYQQLKTMYTLRVRNSGNNVAMNYLDSQELTLRTLAPQVMLASLDTILARSTRNNGKTKPDLDTLVATFDHTIGFETARQAAHIWGQRAKETLKQPKPNGVDHVKCLLKAYALDPNYVDTLTLARNFLNEHMRAGDLTQAEMFLDELDKRQKNIRTLYWRGNLEQKKGNSIAALELFERSGLSNALHNAGAIYHRGDNGVTKNLVRAREYYEKAAQREPMQALHTRALAAIAEEENRHNDRYKLLQKITGMANCTALDAYNLVTLSRSGLISQATTANTYLQYMTLGALAARETKPTLNCKQLDECADVSTCLELQLRKASASEMKELIALEQKGVFEACHSLAYQANLTAQNSSEPELKQSAINTVKCYLQKALDVAPQCNRTLLKLAEFTMPTALCSVDKISETDKAAVDLAFDLYMRVLAAPSNNAYAAEAHRHIALILSRVYQNPNEALAHFQQAARLGSSRAYIALLDGTLKNYIALRTSSLKEYAHDVLNELLNSDIVYDDFGSVAEKQDFDKIVAEAKAVFQADTSSTEVQTAQTDDALSCAASSDV